MNRKMSQAKDKLAFCQLSRIHQSGLQNKLTKIEPFAKNEPLTFAGESLIIFIDTNDLSYTCSFALACDTK